MMQELAIEIFMILSFQFWRTTYPKLNKACQSRIEEAQNEVNILLAKVRERKLIIMATGW